MKKAAGVVPFFQAVTLALTAALGVAPGPALVTLVRVPDGGIQPDVLVDGHGVLHLLYFSGEPRNGNLFYVRSTDSGVTFTAPVRVNSQDGSAIATGTIRGGQLALGREGRVHVGWNGSDSARPAGLINPTLDQPSAPYLYSRSNPDGTAFEPQRNLMQRSYGLDGGGSIAADARGRVYAVWQALGVGAPSGEDHRQVWVARSTDDGATFGAESPAWAVPTGACGCCGVRARTDFNGRLFLLYRSATATVHRDVYLLASGNGGASFTGSRVQDWELKTCPMTSASLAVSSAAIVGAWESADQVYFGRVDPDRAIIASPIAAPGEAGTRKHPRVATGGNGQTLLVWTEGTAWARGGSLAWQVFDAAGHAIGPRGAAPGVPVWSFADAVARPAGGFVIVY
jgi:hypothetical protein